MSPPNNSSGLNKGQSIAARPPLQDIAVPHYLLLDIRTRIAVQEVSNETNWQDNGSPLHTNAKYIILAGNLELLVPADPPLSAREALQLHAEILSLQQTTGCSYLNAATQLYTSELAKLESEELALHGFQRLEETLMEAAK
ncbi:hypothetical protein C0991_010762 [Blastosporella zonata]|nr:hypothetical protein C0991_010762 [Blastosporella zonata]